MPPEGITYQAVAIDNTGKEIIGSDAGGNPIPDRAIGVRFSIISASASGPVVYQETHVTNTDRFGLFELIIGEGQPVFGTFSDLDWGAEKKFLKVEIQLSLDQPYVLSGLQQMYSVPYALYAKYAENPGPEGPVGPPGADGVGITSTVDNSDGTFTINFSNGTSFTTPDFTGPQGSAGAQGPVGAQGPQGPQGAQGLPGLAGAQGPAGVQGPQGVPGVAGNDGDDGIGISSAVNNGNGTFTLNFSDGTSFTTSDFTGPQGPQGPQGVSGPQGGVGPQGLPGVDGIDGLDGQDGVGIVSATDNLDGTFTLLYSDGSTFTTGDLTGPTGPAGIPGSNGMDGNGISAVSDNGNGTFTLNFSDGTSFTTSDFTGPQGPIGPPGPQGQAGAQGLQGPAGNQGPQGPAGTGVNILGSFASPSQLPTFGSSGDAYLILGDLFVWDGAAWQNVGNIQGPTGPMGPAGTDGTDGVDGQDGVGIATTVNNGDGTFTLNFTNGTSFTTSDLTGPQGPTGVTGLTGPAGPQGSPGINGVDGIDGIDGVDGQDGVGISSTVDNGDGTLTFNFSDGSVFTTSDLQGAQGIQGPAGPTGATGPAGLQGLTGPQGSPGQDGVNGQDGNGIFSTVDNADGTFTLNYTDGTSFTTSDFTGPQGPTGATGPQGPAGTGVSILGSFSSSAQLPATGSNGDAYLISGDLFVWNGTSWQNVGNIQGPAGPAGATGPIGPAGPQGSQGLPGMDGQDGINGADGTNGVDGQDGNGIVSTIDNGNGTFTLNFSDGTSFTTADLTGPQGPQGLPGPDGQDGVDGLNGAAGQDGTGIASTTDNGDGTFTLNYTDGTSFTTSDLTGPQGPQGDTGPQGPQGLQGQDGQDGVDGVNGTNGVDGQDGNGIASTIDNGDGTFTLNFTDGTSFTTADFTGPQGPQGAAGSTGAEGPQGLQGLPGQDGADGVNGTNGVDGQDGIAGYNALIKTTPFLADSNCSKGGTIIEVGIDLNRNDTLDLNEVNVQSTAYICNGIGDTIWEKNTNDIYYAEGKVTIGDSLQVSSALLNLESNQLGFLPPRMSEASRVLIQSPAAGLIVYQTDVTSGLYLFNGQNWELLQSNINTNSSSNNTLIYTTNGF